MKVRCQFITGFLLVTLSACLPVFAMNIQAGQKIVEQVCSQCHGMREPSLSGLYPSLAGRDMRRTRDVLRQYRSKKRRSPIMNNLTGSLSNQDINNIAAYYAWVEPLNHD